MLHLGLEQRPEGPLVVGRLKRLGRRDHIAEVSESLEARVVVVVLLGPQQPALLELAVDEAGDRLVVVAPGGVVELVGRRGRLGLLRLPAGR